MKPARFEYYDPITIDEALDLMSQFGDQARPLAGGQSLVPLMNFRLLRPAHLVDLNGVRDLNYLKAENGALRIGATTRQRQLERSADVAQRWPLLREATAFIGHIQIRNRGTVGGSLAHAFPSAELPVAMVTLDASMIIRAKTTRRSVRAEEFFLSYMTTVLEPRELLTEINIPPLPANTGWSYQEVSRRHGDFALAGAASVITLDANGNIHNARLTLTATTPFRAKKAEDSMLGEKPSNALFKNAAQRATENLEQDSDIHGSAEYRRSACAALACRALVQSAQRATELGKGTSR
ncbi:MAG TPA: xanthine dehydrogenase family protein subunit M [Candidatus Binatia bacterium]|jgi:CO/xanthine dehydrogenase FAD-binding subunit|nr:xanthine dehydrogenase family protein subunit M [Candidatus Binatia bacterium]